MTAIILTLVLHYLLPLTPTRRISFVALLWSSVVVVLTYFSTRSLAILLLNYSCYCPDADHRCNLELYEYFGMRSRRYNPQSADFMHALYRKSGLGNETYAPPYIFQPDLYSKLPHAIVQADDGMCSALATLLSKTSVALEMISPLIVACSMFSSVPSLDSRIMNRFQFRSDVKSFNLSGMGCSTRALGMDLAARILRRSPDYALLASRRPPCFIDMTKDKKQQGRSGVLSRPAQHHASSAMEKPGHGKKYPGASTLRRRPDLYMDSCNSH
ncbi:3-ketoacyl-CoA synthase 13 [Platanthera guangdongensis]|uniref:3-ketoacyl-CoA synthase 13 n=1 Tax=Platanthera guangdongensis TaxID=2320717 RepID=A0ABR2LKY6_9ASPA